MSVSSVDIKIGVVIFWNGKYGFIRQMDNSSIYFNQSDVKYSYYKNLKLLDSVSYKIIGNRKRDGSISRSAKYITKENDPDLSLYTRHIGYISDWNGRFGFINRSDVDNKTLLHFSRRLDKTVRFKNNDLVVFNPQISPKNNKHFYAFFAYPLIKEKNIDFLLKEYLENHMEGIKTAINQLVNAEDIYSNSQKFEIALKMIGSINDNISFLNLLSLIKEYKSKNYTPELELLQKFCNKAHLIQLLEMGLIEEYDFEVIKEYFHYTGADNKRVLVIKFNKKDKRNILLYHFEKLKLEGKTRKLNDSIKTLLDIIFRNKESRDDEVYLVVMKQLYDDLSPSDLIMLWVNGYIENLSEKIIADNFDLNNVVLVKSIRSKSKDKFNEILGKIYESYFLNISSDNFLCEFPNLVIRLKIFKEEFETRYSEIVNVIRVKIDDHARFMLCIFDTSFDFDCLKYYKSNHHNLHHFYKIKFFNFFYLKSERIINNEAVELIKISDISQSGLIEYINSNPWDILIHPALIKPEEPGNCCFITEVEEFVKAFNFKGLDIKNLGFVIYNSIPKYEVHHIRLWLNNNVDESLYDSVGFREAFKLLSLHERKQFKNKLQNLTWLTDVVVPESAQVIPCTDYKILDDSNKQYNAFLYNIYFSNGKYMLRKEDGSYTETFNEQYSSSGLNRIPVNSEYNSVSFIFVVSGNNQIVKVTGLSEMLLSFHTGQIEDSLGIVVDITDSNIENISYAEDWKLRKEIIDYLNEAQYDMYKPIVVPEPKNYFRRLDEYSDIDWFELTMLFVIKTEDGFGIIWENIDLTEDRASYVFKSMSENLSEQLDKIADSIKTLAQFRSSLISNKEHEYDRKMLSLFKNNLGYTGTIRKKRGKNKPFGDWLNKIETLLSCAIPAIPSEAELIELKKWNPKIQHHAKINSFTPIDYNRLTNVDTKILDEENEFNAPEVELINNSFENILISLKSFNDIFLKDFKI